MRCRREYSPTVGWRFGVGSGAALGVGGSVGMLAGVGTPGAGVRATVGIVVRVLALVGVTGRRVGSGLCPGLVTVGAGVQDKAGCVALPGGREEGVALVSPGEVAVGINRCWSVGVAPAPATGPSR